MATTFLRAMKALYGTIAGLPTLYLDEVPANTALPHCVMSNSGEMPTEPLEYDENERPVLSEATVTFSLYYANSSDDAENAAILLMDAFTPGALAAQLSTSDFTSLFRLQYRLALSPDHAPSGVRVYVAMVTYRGVFGTEY